MPLILPCRCIVAKLRLIVLPLAMLLFAMPAAHAGPTHEVPLSFAALPQNPSAGALAAGPNGYFWGTAENGGAGGFGSIYKAKADGSDWQTVLSFSNNGTSNKGRQPGAALAYDGSGTFWGTTQQGGASNLGTVFKVDAATGILTTLVEFTGTVAPAKGAKPYGGLISYGGFYWGTTYEGGTSNFGTIFKVSTTPIAGGTYPFTTVVEFTDTTGSFKGRNPEAGLVHAGAGVLWGTTYAGGVNSWGTVFKFDVGSGSLTTVVDFTNFGTPKGACPTAELVSDGAGNFWGTTSLGGANNAGTVFKVSATPIAGGTYPFTTVMEFPDSAGRGMNPCGGLLRDASGNFWGTTRNSGALGYGTFFKLDPSLPPTSPQYFTTNSFTSTSGAIKGAYPTATLVSTGTGSILGTTTSGGVLALGSVFRIDPGTPNVFTTVVEFDYGSNPNRGRGPYGSLVESATGALWGTTGNGGTSNLGTIFKMDPATGVPIPVIDFTGNSGANKGSSPHAGLVSYGGFLWGTTQYGGTPGYGSIFKVDPLTNVLTTLVEFTYFGAVKGAYPAAELATTGGGIFWGTTANGGSSGAGTVFRFDANTSSLTTQDFTGNGAIKGSNPNAALVSDGAGFFWGTTSGGGTPGFGTIFKINAATSAVSTVLEFAGSNGANPWGALVKDGNMMWGTTQAGGSGNGTIFKVDIGTNILATVAQFTGNVGLSPGSSPSAALVRDGNFMWGTTQYGGAGTVGTVFKVDTASGVLTPVVQFTGAGSQAFNGSNPGYGPLYKAADGNFYGTTQNGGPNGGGTVYRLRFGPSPVTQAAASIGYTSALLNGLVNPNNDGDTTVRFEYGTSPTLSGATQTGTTMILNGGAASPAAILASGLQSGATYYYRVRASNAGNAVPQVGGILSFTTVLNNPPGGGTFSVSPTANVQQGDILHLSAPGWTDAQTPLTYQFFRDATSLSAAGSATTLDVTAPGPGSYTWRVRVTDALGAFTDATQIVAVNAGVASWRQTYFNTTANTGNAADLADPNANGVVNLLEYAFHGDPNTGGSLPVSMPTVGLSAGHALQLSFARYLDRTDLTLVVTASDTPVGPWIDLATSVSGGAFVVVEPGAGVLETGSGASRNVTVTDLFTTTDPLHPRRYLRLKVAH